MSRQPVATVVLAVVLAGLVAGGALDAGGLAPPTDRTPAPATLPADALADSEFSGSARTERTTATVSVGGRPATFETAAAVAEYRRSVAVPLVGEAPLAALITVSTPAWETPVGGVNPLVGASNERVADTLVDGRPGVSVAGRDGQRRVRIFGEYRPVTRFRGRVSEGGLSVRAYVHVATTVHEGDHVVVVAVYPRLLAGQREAVLELVSRLDHPG